MKKERNRTEKETRQKREENMNDKTLIENIRRLWKE